MALDTDADDEIGHASPNPFEIQEATEHLPAPAAAPSSSNSSTGSRRWLNKRVKTLIILLLSFGVLLGLIFIIVIPINSESSGTTRKYYIAAETELLWDYAPQEHNVARGRPWTALEERYVQVSENRTGSVYQKARFVQYTDEQFSERVTSSGDDSRGILGPVLRAEVGDTIHVTFLNRLEDITVSLFAPGLHYDRNSEGIQYNAGGEQPGAAVPPQGTYEYTWVVYDHAGPGVNDPDSVVRPYFSAVNEERDFHTGLFGPVVITRKGMADSSGAPKDVKSEIFLLVSTFDENQSWFAEDNFLKFSGSDSVSIHDPAFQESNRMHSINGYVYGNNPTLEVPVGSSARWYIMGMGDKEHVLRFTGHTLDIRGTRTTTVRVSPGECASGNMEVEYTGWWLLEATGGDGEKGMQTLYHVV